MHKFEGKFDQYSFVISQGGWVLLQAEEINSNYTSFCAKPELFSLEAPYLTISQTTVEEESDQPKKKRKKASTPLGDQTRHESIRETIHKAHILAKDILLPLNKDKHAITPNKKDESVDFISWAKLANVVNSFQDKTEFFALEADELDPSDSSLVFNQIVQNSKDKEVEVSLFDTKFVVPKNSSFLMSDITQLQPLTFFSKDLGGFNIIIMDPPWENKSVNRSKSYMTLPNYSLFKLPMSELMSKSGCLVAMWVTNSEKYNSFIKEKYFPYFKIKYLATWYWLKVTNSGDMVTPMESTHRRPYEALIIGYFGDTELPNIEENQVIVSVPGRHSRKPFINKILEKFVDPKGKRLEMFARNLLEGWTSWGNEVLKFQSLNNFNTKQDDPPKDV